MGSAIQDYFVKNRVGHSKPWESGKFKAADNFPDLSKHNNVMASQLTKEVSLTFPFSPARYTHLCNHV